MLQQPNRYNKIPHLLTKWHPHTLGSDLMDSHLSAGEAVTGSRDVPSITVTWAGRLLLARGVFALASASCSTHSARSSLRRKPDKRWHHSARIPGAAAAS